MFVFLMLYSILVFIVERFGDLVCFGLYFVVVVCFAYYVKQKSCNERYYIC